MAEETKKKDAKKVYTLDEIKFNEANKTMAILACIPIVGLVLLFVEKDDKFVRYMAAQSTIGGAISVISPILVLIPILGALIVWLYSIALLVMVIMGMVKASQGERFDFPIISGFALKLMGAI